MARSSASKAVPKSQVVEVTDIDGNVVRIPAQKMDLKEPQQDSDDSIPEFVNISGKRQLVTIPNQPTDTIRVFPMGVLHGAQWRSMSEPAPAWGTTPVFMEREKKNGKYDSNYLLTEEQVKGLVDRLNNPEPGFGARTKLNSFLEFGKVMKFDKLGAAVRNDYSDDRANVRVVATEKILHLEKRWKEMQKEMGIG